MVRSCKSKIQLKWKTLWYGYRQLHYSCKNTKFLSGICRRCWNKVWHNTNKKLTFKNCAPFTNCLNEINITEVDDVQNIDIVIPMYNLMEYSDVYSKTLGILWQYCRDEPVLDNNGNIIDFLLNNNNSILFKFKQEITW